MHHETSTIEVGKAGFRARGMFGLIIWILAGLGCASAALAQEDLPEELFRYADYVFTGGRTREDMRSFLRRSRVEREPLTVTMTGTRPAT